MAGNILILTNYYDESYDKWFLRYEIYQYVDTERLDMSECEGCHGGPKKKLHYKVPLNNIDYFIPEEYCLEVSDEFVADARVKGIHKYVEEEFLNAGLDIKDFQEHAWKLFRVDIFSRETTGKKYEQFKKEMRGYGI